MPTLPISARIRSLAYTPLGSSPSKRARIVRGLRCSMVWVASTCRISDAPMPKPSAPSAPLVQVCESPQTTSVPGWVMPSSGPITCTMPCSSPPTSNRRTPALRVSRRSESTSTWAQSCAPPVRPGADEITWSAVAKVSSGLRTRRPRAATSASALPPPRSCSRCRSTCSSAAPPPRSATTCAFQTLSNSVRAISAGSSRR